jgi:hypothetical protein
MLSLNRLSLTNTIAGISLSDSWTILADLEAKLSSAGQSQLMPLVVRLVCATHSEAVKSQSLHQAYEAREARLKKTAAKHEIFDKAIIKAAEGLKLEPTRKFSESLEAVVYAHLLEINYDGKPPSWGIIMRRIKSMLDNTNNS